MPWSKSYLALCEGIALKLLEKPCVYNLLTDELYELSAEALDILTRCDGEKTVEEIGPDEEFLAYCLEENILQIVREPTRRPIALGKNEKPSLRYLMVEVTECCNLNCLHCYLGKKGTRQLPWEVLKRAVEDFEGMGGLRFIVTGGEPLLYTRFVDLNRLLAGRSFRPVLVTNGTLLEEVDLADFHFREIQFSIDGMERGHDFLRGEGNFVKVMGALDRALEAQLDVSVATVIHRENLNELEQLGEMLRLKGVSSWALEYPVAMGNLAERSELLPEPERAAPLMELEWGGGPHQGTPGYACGAHLACLDTSGRLLKCGYYRDISGGGLEKGLRQAWKDLPKMRLDSICPGCEKLEECGGGCRFRAKLMTREGGPDPIACLRQGRADYLRT